MSLRRGFGRIAQSRGKTIVLQKPKIEYTERVDQPGWSAKSRCVGSVPNIASPRVANAILTLGCAATFARYALSRSEEHTSELQSHSDLVCRLLLEKKKKKKINKYNKPKKQ